MHYMYGTINLYEYKLLIATKLWQFVCEITDLTFH